MLINVFKFPVLISNMVNISRYNTHKQKLFGILSKSVKTSWDQNVWELLRNKYKSFPLFFSDVINLTML